MLLTVYIPKPDTEASRMVAPKSAIVADAARATDANALACYFEGNLNGAVNLNQFYERLICASGRLEQRYPTIAKAAFPIDDLIPVAEFETGSWSITNILDANHLTAWAGESIEEIAGVRLPIGLSSWDEVIPACKNAHPHEVKHGVLTAYRTRAGQIVALDATQRTAIVTDHPAKKSA